MARTANDLAHHYTSFGACHPVAGLGWLGCGSPGTRSSRPKQYGPGSDSTRTGPAPWRPKSLTRSRTRSRRHSNSICLLINSAAQAHGLPIEFFTRLIWQESRFNRDAVGPITRSGQRAQGIAQFLPGTASERGLFDLYDPVAALPKSAEFLEALRAQFGNLGLAAAAYNAGPQRVRDWIAGRGGLPAETRNYVIAITGRNVDEWAAGNRDHNDLALTKVTVHVPFVQ